MLKLQICQKTQLFLDIKKCRYVGDTSGFIQNLITPTDGMPYQKEKPNGT